jgi:hypothetical protein
MSMPVIDIGALFIGRENREGDDGSGIATEDDDDTDAEAGGYTRLGRAFWEEEDDNEDGDEQGQREQRRRRDAIEVRDALRGGAVVVVVQNSPEAPIAGDDHGEGGRGGSVADETKHGRGDDGGDDETGDALVTTTTVNDYHTYNIRSPRKDWVKLDLVDILVLE